MVCIHYKDEEQLRLECKQVSQLFLLLILLSISSLFSDHSVPINPDLAAQVTDRI